MRERCLLVVGAVTLLGCGDDTAGTGGSGGAAASQRYRSGARLKIVVNRAGGAEDFAHVVDAGLDGVVCRPLLAHDGSLRCVPFSNDHFYFLDAACTVPVMGYFPAECGDDGPAPFISAYRQTDPSACEPSLRSRTYRAGAQLTGTPEFVFDGDPASCHEIEVEGDAYFYELSEVAPEELAAIAEVTELRGNNIELTFYESDDGFRMMRPGLRDTAHQVACSPGVLGDARVCVPSVFSGWQPAYADDNCTVELSEGAVSYPKVCNKPTLALLTQPGAAGECAVTHAFEVGNETAPTHELLSPESCSGFDPLNLDYALLGAQVPDTDFPELELIDEGTGPVRLRADYAAGQPVTLTGQWVTASGAPCVAHPFNDGVWRCVPRTVFVPPPGQARYFADAGCTELLAEVEDDPCVDAAPELAVVAGDGNCGGAAPHALGAQHTGDIFVHGGGELCSAVTPSASALYFLVGDELAFDQFHVITTETI